MSTVLRPREAIVLAAIERAARAGLPCPTNNELAEVLDAGSPSGPSHALTGLEKKGLVSVERGGCSRVVTIVATGARTAGKITKLHWRLRPREERPGTKRRYRMRPEWNGRGPPAPPEPIPERRSCFFCGCRDDACRCPGGAK